MKKITLLYFLLLAGVCAQAQNTQWYPLTQGATDSMVTTIDTYDSIIYISGPFKGAFGFIANGFGMYDYVKGHGVNPGSGFTNGYAKSFINYNGIEYAGGNFSSYFRQFNSLTKNWDSIALISSPVIHLDTFQSKIVLATDSFVMLYDTGTHQVTALPQNFNGRLASVTVYQNKIWMAAYVNSADTLSNLYTWDGTTIGDSSVGNKGIGYLHADNDYLFISGRDVGGGQSNDVAIYGGGKFSDLFDKWNFVLFNVGSITSISGNSSSGYIFAGSFVLVDGDGLYHPATLYQNGVNTVLGSNISGIANGSCFTSSGKFILAGQFTLADSSSSFTVVELGPAGSAGITEIPGLKPVIYPNPFHDEFIIKNAALNSSYRLFDELGQTVALIRPAGTELIFQDTQLPAGIYFLKDIAYPGNILKIIKQ